MKKKAVEQYKDRKTFSGVGTKTSGRSRLPEREKKDQSLRGRDKGIFKFRGGERTVPKSG